MMSLSRFSRLQSALSLSKNVGMGECWNVRMLECSNVGMLECLNGGLEIM